MPPERGHVTMSDLAVRLRLSVMTVSRALRNAAGVSAKTRQRVTEAARQMNYRPDPSLAVLNQYRHGKRTPVTSEKIAFVTNFPTAEGWRNVITFARYFEGANKRARQLGYELEPFWLGAAGLSANRASEILHSRGVRGVIVGPLVRGHSTLKLNWGLFSSVALGLSLETPGLATASANHFQGMELACREVTRRGYIRIGYAVTLGDEARTLGRPRASFRMQQEKFSGPWIPPLVVSEFSADAIASWAEEHRPDVLLSAEQTHYDLLRGRLGRRAKTIDYVHLNVDPASSLSGVDQGHDVVGEHAAALLHLKLLQRETGVPTQREMLMIHCTWKEGRGEWALRPPLR
jgi:LacI family transcriptional regulator